MNEKAKDIVSIIVAISLILALMAIPFLIKGAFFYWMFYLLGWV